MLETRSMKKRWRWTPRSSVQALSLEGYAMLQLRCSFSESYFFLNKRGLYISIPWLSYFKKLTLELEIETLFLIHNDFSENQFFPPVILSVLEEMEPGDYKASDWSTGKHISWVTKGFVWDF